MLDGCDGFQVNDWVEEGFSFSPIEAPPQNPTRKNINADSKYSSSYLGEEGWGRVGAEDCPIQE